MAMNIQVSNCKVAQKIPVLHGEREREGERKRTEEREGRKIVNRQFK